MMTEKNIWILANNSQTHALYSGILGSKYGLNFVENAEKLETALKRTRLSPHALIAEAKMLDYLPSKTPILLVFGPEERLSAGKNRRYLVHQNVDFIHGPVREFELLTRLEILLARSQPPTIELTNREAQIFAVFQRAGGDPIQRRQLIKEVWGDVIVGAKTLDVHLFHLRKKVFKAGFRIHFSPPDTFRLTSASGPDC
jgi:hypothetical protein